MKKKEYSGNKFFVLANVTENDRQRVPPQLTIPNQTFGKLVIGLSHRFQIRFCNFCGKRHDAVCQVKLKVEEMKKQRAANHRLHLCGDSTVRYMNKIAFQADVDAMSGGTTGNLMNSLDVDDDFDSKKEIVFVCGSNDKKPTLSPADYIYSLKTIRERVLLLLERDTKRIALVPPPKTDDYLSAEEQVRDELYTEHLEILRSGGVLVWENPLDNFGEDGGTHPTRDQTTTLVKFIHDKVSTDFGIPLLLPTATDDVITLPNKYNHVTPLYKFGCGACSTGHVTNGSLYATRVKKRHRQTNTQ